MTEVDLSKEPSVFKACYAVISRSQIANGLPKAASHGTVFR